jgi:hypothetical protein
MIRMDSQAHNHYPRGSYGILAGAKLVNLLA